MEPESRAALRQSRWLSPRYRLALCQKAQLRIRRSKNPLLSGSHGRTPLAEEIAHGRYVALILTLACMREATKGHIAIQRNPSHREIPSITKGRGWQLGGLESRTAMMAVDYRQGTRRWELFVWSLTARKVCGNCRSRRLVRSIPVRTIAVWHCHRAGASPPSVHLASGAAVSRDPNRAAH